MQRATCGSASLFKASLLQMDNESNVPDLRIPEGVFIASVDDGG